MLRLYDQEGEHWLTSVIPDICYREPRLGVSLTKVCFGDGVVWELCDAGFRPSRRGTFAETKGPRLLGRNPEYKNL